jgi:hypothetical protein
MGKTIISWGASWFVSRVGLGRGLVPKISSFTRTTCFSNLMKHARTFFTNCGEAGVDFSRLLGSPTELVS